MIDVLQPYFIDTPDIDHEACAIVQLLYEPLYQALIHMGGINHGLH